jgi:hypothetical protein
MDEEGLISTMKPVVLPGPSSICSSKVHSHRGCSAGLSVHKALLLKVAALQGSRRSSSLKDNFPPKDEHM